MRYQSGEEIMAGDRVALHGNPAEIEFVVTEAEPADWVYLGRGVMIFEPKDFGHLFLPAEQISDYENLEFVSRRQPGPRH